MRLWCFGEAGVGGGVCGLLVLVKVVVVVVAELGTIGPSHFEPNCFSKNRASKPILSISRNVRMCVCWFVCPSHFLTPFNGLLPPLPDVQCLNFLDFWGKVMERSGLDFENFCP